MFSILLVSENYIKFSTFCFSLYSYIFFFINKTEKKSERNRPIRWWGLRPAMAICIEKASLYFDMSIGCWWWWWAREHLQRNWVQGTERDTDGFFHIGGVIVRNEVAKKVEVVTLVMPRAIACVCAPWPWLYCPRWRWFLFNAIVLLLLSFLYFLFSI